MRFMLRFAFIPAIALAVGVTWAYSAGAASAYSPMVTMVDNDAPAVNQGIDMGQGYWGFGPNQVVVHKGEQVLFVNPSTNKRPHTVTSIALSEGGNFDGALAAGNKFDSSPSREALVTPGNNWTLDTNNLDPGNYAYYCRLHPWMVGELTVLPAGM
jgi:plastocyanin